MIRERIKRKSIFKKAHLSAIAGFLVLTCSIAQPVWAENTGVSYGIYDRAGLLTEEENSDLEEELEAFSDKSGWEVFVLTTEDAGGYTTREYSEEFLNAHLTGDDGIVYTIDMDNREVYLATTGEAVYYLTDDRIEDIIDSGYGNVADGFYADAFSEMIEATADAWDMGIPSDQYTYDTDTGEIVEYKEPKSIKWYEALIAFAVACGAFAAVFLGILGKYRLKWGTYKYDFHANGRVNLTNQEDRFVNQLVTHHHIQRNTSSGGSSGGGSRSSVHTGSGGRSYGGGGRKF